MKLIEAISKWTSGDLTRLTVVSEDGIAKIQIDLLTKHKHFGTTAFIWDLYVHPDHRRKGIAKELMQYALRRAKEHGHTTATLEWNLKDTPREVAWWYADMGFDEKEFSNTYALMVKQL